MCESGCAFLPITNFYVISQQQLQRAALEGSVSS